MSCYRWSALVALVCVAVVSLAPHASAVPKGLLAQLVDRSICKSVVKYNENEKRIPRLIKEVKCAPKPDAICLKSDGETSCCAQNSNEKVGYSCEEVLDTVLVSYADATEPEKETVSVGCSCVSHPIVTAEEVS